MYYDRRQEEAIKTAVSLSGNEDIILVAGKGHEKYQEINGVKHALMIKSVGRYVRTAGEIRKNNPMRAVF